MRNITPFKTIEWTENGIVILDQRKLPTRVTYLLCQTPNCVVEAIRTLAVRGAPAIGVAAAMGLALGARQIQSRTKDDFLEAFNVLCEKFAASRPTAVNLFWAIRRMQEVADAVSLEGVREALEAEAQTIWKEDIAINRAIGRHGNALLPSKAQILTHCNAGALATGGYGTALGVIYTAYEAGKDLHVYADETRPVLQGARLTAWELAQHGVPVTLVTENMAGMLMKAGKIDLVIVGADRIARNGDTANKIGTYSLAVLARYHGIPFYVAAPTSTFDRSLSSGESIPIEYRHEEEIFYCGNKRVAPRGIAAFNPAFDITPADLITAIITEKGVLTSPGPQAIDELFQTSPAPPLF